MESLKQVRKQTGVTPPELANLPKMPHELMYIWEWYQTLRGSEYLTNTEIVHWCILYKVELEDQELELLRQMDSTYWRVMNE